MNDKTYEKLNIPAEKFKVVKRSEVMHDLAPVTKPVGFFKDAFRRFCKNKSSVVAAIIIGILILFSIVGGFITPYDTSFSDINLANLLPKSDAFEWLGWDGCKNEEIKAADYIRYRAIERETGDTVIRKDKGSKWQEVYMGEILRRTLYYDVYVDSYTKNAIVFMQFTKEQYEALQRYQDETGIQVIYPAIPERTDIYKDDANLWYEINAQGANRGLPTDYNTATGEYTLTPTYVSYTGNDGYSSKRIEGETARYDYAIRVSGGNYKCRVQYSRYCYYKDGRTPSFLFGSDQFGKDIFGRLAAGARFSFLFAIAISAINLFIGAIYGAIEGYYGGAVDMVMERVSDILSGVPFMVVVTLFKLYVADKVGTVATLLFAFVLTGWIGMAGSTRMQFYRYKNQEYVLAARTLGARDGRIMFRHIFPNALGTLVTSCVLVIPSVIFSESSLSYLGIINLSTSSITSVGTMMANGQGSLSTYPHIIFFPALFVSLLMISFNLFGNGLRDAFNPSLRGAED